MRRLMIAVLVLFAFTACGDDDPAAATTTAVAVVSTEYAFEVPETVALEGLAKISFSNQGKEAHQATLLKIADGKSLADVTSFLTASEGGGGGPRPTGPPPFSAGGGTAAIAPGGRAEVTQAFSEGQYAFICFVPSPDGAPHFAKGMVKAITFTGGTKPGVALPEGSTATAKDFSYELPALKAGSATIVGKNVGAQDHEFQVARVADGKAAPDALAWLNAPQGPPPFVPEGGLIVARFGGEGAFTLDLKPGTYIVFCNIPDDASGVPHVRKGMFSPVTVT